MERVKVTKQLLDDSVIPEGIVLWDEREKLVREWAGWLRRNRSAVVGTLRFETVVQTEEAEKLFDEWIRKVQVRNRLPLEWRGGPWLAHVVEHPLFSCPDQKS